MSSVLTTNFTIVPPLRAYKSSFGPIILYFIPSFLFILNLKLPDFRMQIAVVTVLFVFYDTFGATLDPGFLF